MKYVVLLSIMFILTVIDRRLPSEVEASRNIASNPITSDCTCNNTRLWGRVRFVNDNADFRIRFVQHDADLRIKFVTFPANTCGQWQVVEDGEDFTVRVVGSSEDFTVQMSESLPGIN